MALASSMACGVCSPMLLARCSPDNRGIARLLDSPGRVGKCAASSNSVLSPTPVAQPGASHGHVCLPRRHVIHACPAWPALGLHTSERQSAYESSTRAEADEGTAKEDRTEEKPQKREQTQRRSFLVVSAILWQQLDARCSQALARERRQKTDFPENSYYDAGNGLKYLDLEEGKGKETEAGEEVKVHFEVKYGPLSVVSTRESKLLGGNRSISQPYEFTVGAQPYAERKRKQTQVNASDLFSARAAPRPPKALYAAVLGMRVGGKRVVLVPAEQGYGTKGYNEIPPGASIQMVIDLLEVVKEE